MFKNIRKAKGQSTLEYAILIIIIIAALLTLQTYIKRGVQGRLASSTDSIGDQFSQAKPANYYKVVTTNSLTLESLNAGVSETKLLNDVITNTYQHINLNADDEYWGIQH